MGAVHACKWDQEVHMCKIDSTFVLNQSNWAVTSEFADSTRPGLWVILTTISPTSFPSTYHLKKKKELNTKIKKWRNKRNEEKMAITVIATTRLIIITIKSGSQYDAGANVALWAVGWRWNRVDFLFSVASPVFSIQPIRLSKNWYQE